MLRPVVALTAILAVAYTALPLAGSVSSLSLLAGPEVCCIDSDGCPSDMYCAPDSGIPCDSAATGYCRPRAEDVVAY